MQLPQSINFHIVRITNIPYEYFERVICPGDRLTFETVLGAKLEIYSSGSITSLLSDCILCESLQISPSDYSTDSED
jgi:hypothetical protein